MKVSECMSTDVRVASPKQTIAEAAGMMSECDSGILPVGENDRLVGMVTDRDIVIRASIDVCTAVLSCQLWRQSASVSSLRPSGVSIGGSPAKSASNPCGARHCP